MYYSERKCKNHRAEWYRPRGYVCFCPRVVRVVHDIYMYEINYFPGMGPYHARVRRGIDHEPQANLKSASWNGAHTPCGAV